MNGPETPNDDTIEVAPAWLLEKIAEKVDPPRPKPAAIAPWDGDKRARLYGLGVLNSAADELRQCKDNRNDRLNWSAFRVAQFAAASGITEEMAESALIDAAHGCGLVKDDGLRQCLATFLSGWKKGLNDPREIPPAEEKNTPPKKRPAPTVNASEDFDDLVFDYEARAEEMDGQDDDGSDGGDGGGPSKRQWDKRAPESVAAEILAPELRRRFRYHHGADRWMAYQPEVGVWRETFKSVVWAALAEAVDAHEMAPSGYGERYITSILGILRRHLGVMDFSKRTGFTNGVLQSGAIVPHSPEHLLVNALPYAYDPEATCEPIIEWLHFAMKGNSQLVHILRCFLHGVVNGRADFQVFLELLGPGGSGKGTFMRLTHALVGKHASYATDLKQMEENRFESAAFRDKLLIQVNDADRYGGSVGVLKRLTGYDEIRVEEKGKQQSGGFMPTAMVIITVNEAIRSSDYTSGLARRRITIRFDNQIDMAGARNLMAEFQPYLPGLYNWVNAISPEQANRDLHACFDEVAAIAATRTEVEMETNPIAAWANECLFYLPGGRTKIGEARRIPGKAGESAAVYLNAGVELYPSYCEWCSGTGASSISQGRFSKNLLDLLQNQYKLDGIVHKRFSNGYNFTGVVLSGQEGPLGKPLSLEEARSFARSRIRLSRRGMSHVNPDINWFIPGNVDTEGLSEPSEPNERHNSPLHMRAHMHAHGAESEAKGAFGSRPSHIGTGSLFEGSELFRDGSSQGSLSDFEEGDA